MNIGELIEELTSVVAEKDKRIAELEQQLAEANDALREEGVEGGRMSERENKMTIALRLAVAISAARKALEEE